ncbi:MAG TPA: MBOAT family O-acyltransferase, partial [Phycisphaeraceae bacterium]
ALYVAFFPQLVAGPIERADRLMHQIQDRRPRDADDVLAGVTRILWGLLKKVVFADWLAVYVNMAYGHPNAATPWDLLLATYAFAFQIYLDFSAYSDIAIGLSRTMGVKLVENFRWPYLSRNVGEFWRRWHISLSTWLRDYLYIPLGGSRRGMARTASNVIIVMFLGGLWHGADWKFAVWGLYIGLALAVHHAWARWRGTRVDENTPFAWRQAPAILLTFHVILVSWVFFRAESMGSALRIFERLGELRLPMTFNWPEADVARPAIILLLAALAHLLRGLGLTQRLAQVRSPVAVGALWGVMIVLIALLFAPIRARFIYFQF